MFKNPDFYYERGCLWWIAEIGALVYAIISLSIDPGNFHAWIILICEGFDFVAFLCMRRVRKKNYYREDSFWLRKDEEETAKTENGTKNDA